MMQRQTPGRRSRQSANEEATAPIRSIRQGLDRITATTPDRAWLAAAVDRAVQMVEGRFSS